MLYLSREKYHRRRWFLTILFLLLGLLLVYLSYVMFLFNVNKSKLTISKQTPNLIELYRFEKSRETLIVKLYLNKTNAISNIITDTSVISLSSTLNKYFNTNSIGTNFLIKEEELKNHKFQYSYYKNKLYELKINNSSIISYKEKSNFWAFLILVIALLWIIFQGWVLFNLITKGRKNYEDYNLKV